ncbi:MAG TPA: hypothetical protein VHZ24_23095 [Pirellulales bacterium]|jgi:hypothetical protein|nr:hypothetical protein [Pirellulales bacterium]
MIALIPMACALLAGGGGVGLFWYYGLSKQEQAEADRMACQVANELYNATVDQLTSQQMHRVHMLVKSRFVD